MGIYSHNAIGIPSIKAIGGRGVDVKLVLQCGKYSGNLELRKIGKEKPDLEKKFWLLIKNKIEQYYQRDSIAWEVFSEMKFVLDFFPFNWSGMAALERSTIYLNLEIYRLNKKDYNETVIHEFIHLVDFKKKEKENPHDEDFKKQMEKMGYEGKETCLHLKPAFVFTYKCMKCKETTEWLSPLSKDGECILCGHGHLIFKVKRAETSVLFVRETDRDLSTRQSGKTPDLDRETLYL